MKLQQVFIILYDLLLLYIIPLQGYPTHILIIPIYQQINTRIKYKKYNNKVINWLAILVLLKKRGDTD